MATLPVPSRLRMKAECAHLSCFAGPTDGCRVNGPRLSLALTWFPRCSRSAGAPVSDDLPGLNLLDHLVTGKRVNREAIFGEGFAHDIADVKNPEASLLYRWCIEAQWKLLLTYDGEVNRYKSTHPRLETRPQLFDLLADPHESLNRAAEHPDVVARLVGRIQNWYPVRQRRTVTEF